MPDQRGGRVEVTYVGEGGDFSPCLQKVKGEVSMATIRQTRRFRSGFADSARNPAIDTRFGVQSGAKFRDCRFSRQLL